MSHRTLLGFFERETDILGAVRAVRQAGFRIADVYAPYAVHGMDKAMGLAPSKLPWVCFLLGLLGAALKVWFEFWTTAQDWPINVGGKPWNSLPAFVPVTFEVMVLFAGVSTVLAFLLVSRLWPGKQAVLADVAVTDHHFVLVVEESDAAFDAVKVHRLLRQYNVVNVEERVESTKEAR
jgi:Alternative complex III, ActD subunit